MLVLALAVAMQQPQSPAPRPVALAAVSLASPTPVTLPVVVNLGRDMTPTTEHVKPPVVPKVVRVQIAAPTPHAAPKPVPVKLSPPPYDGQR